MGAFFGEKTTFWSVLEGFFQSETPPISGLPDQKTRHVHRPSSPMAPWPREAASCCGLCCQCFVADTAMEAMVRPPSGTEEKTTSFSPKKNLLRFHTTCLVCMSVSCSRKTFCKMVGFFFSAFYQNGHQKGSLTTTSTHTHTHTFRLHDNPHQARKGFLVLGLTNNFGWAKKTSALKFEQSPHLGSLKLWDSVCHT